MNPPLGSLFRCALLLACAAGKFFAAAPVKPNVLLIYTDDQRYSEVHGRYGLVGDDGACPYFWPIGDKHILAHFSHMSGGKYMLGDYGTRREKFVVIQSAELLPMIRGIQCRIHAVQIPDFI